MYIELKPSLEIWKYYGGSIFPLTVVSAIADRLGGYHISYSATELLKDLDLLTPHGKPSKKAIEIVAMYLHEKIHRNREAITIIIPKGAEHD